MSDNNERKRIYYTVENGPLRNQKDVDDAIKMRQSKEYNWLSLIAVITLMFLLLISLTFGLMTGAFYVMGLMETPSPPPSPPPSPDVPLPRPPPLHPPPSSPSPHFPPGAPSDRPQTPPPPPSLPPPFSPYPPVSPFGGSDGVKCTNPTSRARCGVLQMRFGLAHGESESQNGVLSTGSFNDDGACSFCVSNHKTSFTEIVNVPVAMSVEKYCITIASSGSCSCVC